MIALYICIDIVITRSSVWCRASPPFIKYPNWQRTACIYAIAVVVYPLRLPALSNRETNRLTSGSETFLAVDTFPTSPSNARPSNPHFPHRRDRQALSYICTAPEHQSHVQVTLAEVSWRVCYPTPFQTRFKRLFLYAPLRKQNSSELWG